MIRLRRFRNTLRIWLPAGRRYAETALGCARAMSSAPKLAGQAVLARAI
jgi:hypothetical protein